MNKLNQTLVTINGLIIPLALVFVLYKTFASMVNDRREPESIIVGPELDEARSDSLALQGIDYESPWNIYNSTNFYLPVSVKTYEEPRKTVKLGLVSSDFGGPTSNYFNVIFLDKNYNVIGTLLDKKASITDIHINRGQSSYRNDSIDRTVKHIAYLIGFADTNADGKLSPSDSHDLYITDLSGKNLTQVTRQKDIVSYQFINANSELFVQFKDRDNTKAEYKKVKFGVYNIASGTFSELKDLEKKLTEVEIQLNQ